MDHSVLEEQLREAACEGDLDRIKALINQGVDINSKHKMNGWTSLHWAVKRGHVSIIVYLLSQGADKEIMTNKDEKPGDLTSDEQILKLLGQENLRGGVDSLPITPNYIEHPKFPYANLSSQSNPSAPINGISDNKSKVVKDTTDDNDELVLKARVANIQETDFIEIELPMNQRTFNHLKSLMCRELDVDPSLVQKIRKLPDTIVRKDKDVMRFQHFQELELVMTSKAMSAATRSYGLPTMVAAKDGKSANNILFY